MRILIVDDFGLARERTRRSLLALGVSPENIHEAADGKAALGILQQAATLGPGHDLVITDWNMPVMTGLELIKACRADDNLRGLKILVVSSEGEGAAIMEVLKAGADDYAIKPLADDDLVNRMTRLFKRTA